MSSIVMEHVIDFCLHGIPLCLRQSANDPINPYVLACLPVYPLVCLPFYAFVYLIFSACLPVPFRPLHSC